MGQQDSTVKSAYYVTRQQYEWLRRRAFDRGVTASQVLREILDHAGATSATVVQPQQATAAGPGPSA